uniref:ATP-dependent DNA helicase n=1 Tax=Anopheles epiroticus TaxID=199890 RepID=A0A182PWP5_9DIPT
MPQNISGIPVHRLRLKRFAPVLLLRNLNSDMGLCNETRLQIADLKRICLHAKILTGKRRGEDIPLPRICCDSNDKGHPFQISREQFPVQGCIEMTINKSQGQSFHHLGMYLPQDVFVHGELYVALSRVTSRANVAVLIPNPERADEEAGPEVVGQTRSFHLATKEMFCGCSKKSSLTDQRRKWPNSR